MKTNVVVKLKLCGDNLNLNLEVPNLLPARPSRVCGTTDRMAAAAEPMDTSEGEPKVSVGETSGDNSSATFSFHQEDHTIGNTLRYILNKTPEVAFVGYSVPHPSEPKMNLRLQTVGPPATTVLHNALGTVYEIGGHVLSTFDEAVAAHKQQPR